MVGVVWAAAVLLGVAGIGKLLRPGPLLRVLRSGVVPGVVGVASIFTVRLIGLVEAAVAGAVLGWGGATAAVLLSVSYLILSLVSWLLIRDSPGEDCGCIGSSAEPISRYHLLVNGGYLLAAVAAVRWPQPGVIAEVESQGAQSILLITLALLLAWLSYLLMTAFPALLALRTKVASSR